MCVFCPYADARVCGSFHMRFIHGYCACHTYSPTHMLYGILFLTLLASMLVCKGAFVCTQMVCCARMPELATCACWLLFVCLCASRFKGFRGLALIRFYNVLL